MTLSGTLSLPSRKKDYKMKTFLEYVNESGQRNVWTKELVYLFLNELHKNVYTGHYAPKSGKEYYSMKSITSSLIGTKYRFNTSNELSVSTWNMSWWSIPDKYLDDIEDEYGKPLDDFDESDTEDFKTLQDIYDDYLEVEPQVKKLLPLFLKKFEKEHGLKIKVESKSVQYHTFTIVGGALHENFVSGGKKYTYSFGRYYKDGEKISKDEYYAAKPKDEEETKIETAIKFMDSEDSDSEYAEDLLRGYMDMDEYIETFAKKYYNRYGRDIESEVSRAIYPIEAAAIAAEEAGDAESVKYLESIMDKVEDAIKDFVDDFNFKHNRDDHDEERRKAEYYHAKYGDPL